MLVESDASLMLIAVMLSSTENLTFRSMLGSRTKLNFSVSQTDQSSTQWPSVSVSDWGKNPTSLVLESFVVLLIGCVWWVVLGGTATVANLSAGEPSQYVTSHSAQLIPVIHLCLPRWVHGSKRAHHVMHQPWYHAGDGCQLHTLQTADHCEFYLLLQMSL